MQTHYSMSLYAIVKYHMQELVYKDKNGRADFEKEILKYFILCSAMVTLDEKKPHTTLISECYLRDIVFYSTLKTKHMSGHTS